VVAGGDADLAARDLLESQLRMSVEDESTREVVLDLRDVRFLDSSGLAVLVKVRRLAREAGKRFWVEGATGMVRDVMDLTGVWGYLAGGHTSVTDERAADQQPMERSHRKET